MWLILSAYIQHQLLFYAMQFTEHHAATSVLNPAAFVHFFQRDIYSVFKDIKKWRIHQYSWDLVPMVNHYQNYFLTVYFQYLLI